MKEWICQEEPLIRSDGAVVGIGFSQMVELVRCKDCKYGESVNAVYLCGKSRSFGIAHEPDWFCADGERAVKRK